MNIVNVTPGTELTGFFGASEKTANKAVVNSEDSMVQHRESLISELESKLAADASQRVKDAVAKAVSDIRSASERYEMDLIAEIAENEMDLDSFKDEVLSSLVHELYSNYEYDGCTEIISEYRNAVISAGSAAEIYELSDETSFRLERAEAKAQIRQLYCDAPESLKKELDESTAVIDTIETAEELNFQRYVLSEIISDKYTDALESAKRAVRAEMKKAAGTASSADVCEVFEISLRSLECCTFFSELDCVSEKLIRYGIAA